MQNGLFALVAHAVGEIADYAGVERAVAGGKGADRDFYWERRAVLAPAGDLIVLVEDLADALGEEHGYFVGRFGIVGFGQ